jgi:hypothetical protein
MDRGNFSRERPGCAAVGAQCDVDRGTKPLCGGAASRGRCFVSTTGDFGVNQGRTLARAYEPAMPGPA